MRIDLQSNTVDGRRLPGAIVELAQVLIEGPLSTDEVIMRLYGVAEPEDARNAVRQLAFRARRMGVPIHGNRTGCRGGGQYRIGAGG